MRKLIAIFLMLFIGITGTSCLKSLKKPVPKIPAKINEESHSKLIHEPNISLYINETGEKKYLKIEEYIQGVVAAEMDNDWPPEALAAQAILARTFTMKKISEGGVKAHKTDASTSVEEFQGYAPQKINISIKNAVYSTRGKVVVYKGQYINAWFHADSGGKTAASSSEGLEYQQEKTPYIKSVVDPGAAKSAAKNKAWEIKIPLRNIEHAVLGVTGKDPGTITKAGISTKGASGRVTQLKFNNTLVSAPALRLAIGSEKMRSTMLTNIFISGGAKLVITGKGYGHGIGMSQWGAKAMAEEGKKADQIIKYFYKDVSIKKIWQ